MMSVGGDEVAMMLMETMSQGGDEGQNDSDDDNVTGW